MAWPRVVVGAAAQMAAAGSVVSGELEQGGGRAYRARWTWLKAQEWSKRGTWGGEGLLLLLLAQLRRHPCEGQAARVWRCRCLDAWLWRGGAHADDATVSPPHPPIPPNLHPAIYIISAVPLSISVAASTQPCFLTGVLPTAFYPWLQLGRRHDALSALTARTRSSRTPFRVRVPLYK